MTAQLARRIAGALLAVVLLILLYGAWRSAAWHAWLRGLLVGMVVLAAVRPRDALLIVAGLSALAAVTSALTHAPYPLREAVVLAVFTGWALRLAAVRRAAPVLPSDLAGPLLCLFVVILTSSAVELWAHRELLGPAEFRASVGNSLWYGLLVDRHGIRGLSATFWYLEGLGLFTAILVASERDRTFAVRVAVVAAAGAAGAALLNVMRIVNAAIAAPNPSFAARLRELAMTIRVNVHFPDVNAAGSYFAMMFFPAAGVAATRGWWRRAVGLSCAFVIFAAAWLTKSRASVGAILMVAIGVILIALVRRRARRSLGIWISAVACALVVVIFIRVFPNRMFGPALQSALDIRLVLVRVSMQIFATQPVFGVGVGGFYDSSAPFLATSPLGGIYIRENAHNNFLQGLAEFGVVGLAVAAWLLWQLLRRWLSRGSTGDAVAKGAVAGVAAFALTALIGHPLVTPEVNQAFWLMLGAAAGAYGGAGTTQTTRRTWWVVAVFAALMIAALPWRFHSEVETLDLEHIRYGVSKWTTDSEGVRYQTFRERATLFVSSDMNAATIPLREPQASDGVLQIYVEGRLANEVRTESQWRNVRVLAGGAGGRKRFHRIDLVASPRAGGGAREIWIGRVALTPGAGVR
jgi:O-Antigen ligase